MDYSENFNRACDLGNLVSGHKGLNSLDVESLMGSALVINVSTSSKEIANVALYINSKDDAQRVGDIVNKLSEGIVETLGYKRLALESQIKAIDNILSGGRI